MRTEDILDILRKDIEIPEIVQNKADEAFEIIRNKCVEKKKRSSINGKKAVVKTRKMLVACAVAAVLIVGGTCFAAIHWGISRSTEKQLQISKEQKAFLEGEKSDDENNSQAAESDNLATFPNASATDMGITISVQDCIVDDYNARITLRVDGYELPEEVAIEKYQPELFFSVAINGENNPSWGEFYDGLYKDNYTEIIRDEDVQDYQFADGSMEYVLQLPGEEKGFYINKSIQIKVHGIGYYFGKTGEAVTELDGDWNLEWILQGSDSVYKTNIRGGAIGDTGAVLTYLELSPISVRTLIYLPRQEKEEKTIFSEDETDSHIMWEEPPKLSGVKMKDGTSYYNIWQDNGGIVGYVGTDMCQVISYSNRIVDTDQIEYLLFQKNYPENRKMIDDDFWFVKVQ